MKSKIAAIGEKDIILIFKGIGVDIFPIDDALDDVGKIEQVLKNIIRDEFKIIFMTESIAVKIDNLIKQYLDKPIPSIVVIPGLGIKTNYAVGMLRNAIVKAVGTDVFEK